VAARRRPDKQPCTKSIHPLFPLSRAFTLLSPFADINPQRLQITAARCWIDATIRAIFSFHFMLARPDIEWSLIGSAQSQGFANFVKSSLRLFTANFLGRRNVALNISLSLSLSFSFSLRISQCHRFVNLLRKTPRAIYVLFLSLTTPRTLSFTFTHKQEKGGGQRYDEMSDLAMRFIARVLLFLNFFFYFVLRIIKSCVTTRNI